MTSIEPLLSRAYFLDKDERKANQELNVSAIYSCLHKYDSSLRNQPIALELKINGKNESCLLSIDQLDTKLIAKIIFGKDEICEFKIELIEEKFPSLNPDSLTYVVRNSHISTKKGFEGNGLARGLASLNKILLSWINMVVVDKNAKVLEIHVDDAHGAEEAKSSPDSYREGWTSTQLAALGYTNEAELLKQIFKGSSWENLADLGLWVKVLR